jgi:hypothetical protein
MKVTSTFCELIICCYNSLKSLRSVKRCLHHGNTKLFYCGYKRYFSILSSLSKYLNIMFFLVFWDISPHSLITPINIYHVYYMSPVYY